MNRDQRRLDRLLGGSPDLSVQEKEDMLRHVLQPRDERRLWRSPWLWASAMTAAIAVIVVPVVMREHGGGEFGSRGGQMVHGSFHVVCDGASSLCRHGETMRFDLMPPDGAPYFSAAALGEDGLLVWYFPDDSGGSLRADAAGVAARGVLIGDEQPAGSYRIIGAFTEKPITRDELKRAIEGGATSLHLVHETLEVK